MNVSYIFTFVAAGCFVAALIKQPYAGVLTAVGGICLCIARFVP